MPYLALNVGNHLPSIGLIPAAIELLGRESQLDYEIAGQVLRLDLTPLLTPKLNKGRFIVAHDDPGVRATDEITAVLRGLFPHHLFHPFLRRRE
jgi:hypothetical protein